MIPASPKTIPAAQLGPVLLADEQHDEERDREEPQNRQGVRDLAERFRDRPRSLHRRRLVSWPVARVVTLPGFVNTHSHAFQRALRGRAAGGDFWAWRDGMLAEAERQTPETVRALYERDVPRDASRRLHGGRRVPLPRARRRRTPPRKQQTRAGIAFVCLHVAYARGGLERMRQPSVAAYLDEVERAPRRAESRSASPPTPSAHARATGSSSSAATQPPSGSSCMSTPASSRARSRSASQSTASARSSCSPDAGCLGR